MRFTEAERMQHPQVSLIPETIWERSYFFGREISNELIALMQADSADLPGLLSQFRSTDTRAKSCAFLAAFYSHPTLSDETCHEHLQRMSLSLSIQLSLAHALQKPSLLELIFENEFPRIQSTIASGNYEDFYLLVKYGQLDILNRLFELEPNRVEAMIEAMDYQAFRSAASNGHLDVLNRLILLAPNRVEAMIEAMGYMAFRLAASNGHLDVVNRLILLAPNHAHAMIAVGDYDAFRLAARHGHLDVLNRLIELAPHHVQAMIQASDYEVFCLAARHGHLDVLNRLIELAPHHVQVMIEASDYEAFREAARYGHLDVLNRFFELAPHAVQSMIIARNYEAFREAARHGHLDILNRFFELVPHRVHAMITARNYEAFREAAHHGHPEVVRYLLQFTSVFAYAEIHAWEYGRAYTHAFIEEKLIALREAEALFQHENPRGVFDIEDRNESRLYVYMVRNLIRRNDASLQDDMLFLMSIPSVKALLHTAVTGREQNELLRLALNVGNQSAAEALMAIRAVREQAQANNFYSDERRGELDLRNLARDRESSMVGLTQGEQARLSRANAHYQAALQSQGISGIMEDLRNTLVSRFEANPARITKADGTELNLPMAWDAFEALNLNAADRARALEAYYQHPDHTAYRYLSRPNRWMAPDASYVYINDERTERWSTFEEYQSLISMLYLAAKDENTPAINGYTLETRIEQFIKELAYIGRAHNWDRTDEAGNEYDDLEGDKPSCYSGVKRRLFQAVQGHPLLHILTRDDLNEEIRSFVRGHFQAVIANREADALARAWDDLLMGMGESTEILSELNISDEAQDAFIETLRTRYDSQLDEDLVQYVRAQFTCNAVHPNHAIRFGGVVDLSGLLETPVEAYMSGYPEVDAPLPVESTQYEICLQVINAVVANLLLKPAFREEHSAEHIALMAFQTKVHTLLSDSFNEAGELNPEVTEASFRAAYQAEVNGLLRQLRWQDLKNTVYAALMAACGVILGVFATLLLTAPLWSKSGRDYIGSFFKMPEYTHGVTKARMNESVAAFDACFDEADDDYAADYVPAYG